MPGSEQEAHRPNPVQESQFHRPNPMQEAAVAHGSGPVRILAGAGSGKTSTLVRRILSLVADGHCRPGQILMLTFTRKAVAEIRERVAAVLGEGREQPRIETYHAFAFSLVQEFSAELGLPPEPVLLTPGPIRLFLRRHFDRLGIRHLDLSRLGPAVDRVLHFFSWHRHEGSFLRPDAELLALVGEAERPPLAELLAAHRRYRGLLVEQGAVDYDDLIAQAVTLLEHDPVARAAVRERYPYLLVDEYQDTDPLQGRFIFLLAGEAGNITMVGDPDQTIYGFRGATVANILGFAAQFPRVVTLPMVTNYRSTPAILAAANAVIRHNALRKEKPLEADREQGDLPDPIAIEAPDWEKEAFWLAAEVSRLHHEEGVPYRQMAVLVRLNTQKLQLYAALAEAGVPVVIAGGLSLLDDQESARLVAYLQALADPGDDQGLALALTLPRYGMTDHDLARLGRERARGERLFDVVERNRSGMPSLQAFLDEFWPLYRMQHAEGTEAVIRAALRLHGRGLARQARVNGDELLSLFRTFLAQAHLLVDPADRTSSLGQFCQYLQALRDLGDDPEGVALNNHDEGVRLMTVHAAKGLEFPVVFLPRLVEGDFPKGYRQGKADFPPAWRHDAGEGLEPAEAHMEEERRAFYVAVTRARDRLYLSWAPLDPARKRPRERSRFLAELGETVVWRSLPGPAAGLKGAEAIGLGGLEAADPEVADPEVADPEGADPEGAEAVDPGARVAAGIPAGLAALASKAPARPLPTTEPAMPFVAKPVSVLSFSHLSTYQYCPYRFFLAYMVRLPGRPAPSADAGVRIHAALERLGAARRFGVPVEFAEFTNWAASSRVVEEADLDGAAATEQGEPHSGMVPDDETTALRNFWASEYGEAVPLVSEQEFYLRLGSVAVRGFIDRVHQRADGSVEVVDFKTYNRVLSEAEVRRSLQLPLYVAACRAVLGLEGVDTGAMYFLKQDVTVRVRYDEAELAERLAEAEGLVAAIRAGDWAPTPSRQGCSWCPYGEICPVSMAE